MVINLCYGQAIGVDTSNYYMLEPHEVQAYLMACRMV